VGERERKDDGAHFTLIREQLRVGFTDIPATKISSVLIVYEPLWTIGADDAMNPRDMHEMAIFIRKTMVGLYGKQGMKAVILYGGSIDETNAVAMLREGDVEGLLVGRASSDSKEFAVLLDAINKGL
jgi:triosephosphate isomerase